MKKLILHVGMGKCGSSALQEYLSFNNSLIDTQGNKYLYACMNTDGTVYSGNLLEEKASNSPFNYASSPNLKQINDKGLFINNFQTSMKKINSNVIFSSEGWSSELELFNDLIFKSVTDYQIEVVFFVRPPVAWINSAWWQWGAWADVSFDKWIDKNIPATLWSGHIREWFASEHIDKTHVKLLNKNVIESFSEIFNLKLNKKLLKKSNVSLPGTVLRFFQNNRDLRPGPHDSSIDFILSKYINIDSKPDWVIPEVMVKDIVQKTLDSNTKLLEYLTENDRLAMKDDPKWWQVDAFQDLYSGVPKNFSQFATHGEYTQNDMEVLTKQLINSIITLDKKLKNIPVIKNQNHNQLQQFLDENYPDKADMYRDLAIYFGNDIDIGKLLIDKAYSLRPKGPVINKIREKLNASR
ncbi:hypothetical protein THMIRHAM_05330 [Thiomicrorhabdus immobilis]|uniref:Sulfotransferase family protein n=1 Tax=Thiomicrorhabdus immobilis TaxID=2791037 RepID=A0ABM7MBN0_9GAMM|nr:hypothetical protein [Thiomicrorhabdus immobilis]BCN92748.1 hypothetical protein THMIRHAM_05330 [Thiomicrorhabdus immobilis]